MPTCGHGHVVEILATKEYPRRVTRCLNAINDYANKLLAVYTQLGGYTLLNYFHQKNVVLNNNNRAFECFISKNSNLTILCVFMISKSKDFSEMDYNVTCFTFS